MIELADDIDISVAVSAIGLLKQLLRHQLLADEELGPLYDLLIDESPLIRRAVGELVFDHLIAQKFSSSQPMPKGMENESELPLGRLLQILKEFSTDPILSDYVIDAIWVKAMKDWKCIISMLLDDNPRIELTEKDATNLVRVLCASMKKAVGEKIVPTADNRKPSLSKAQKEVLDNNKREVTAGMMKHYPQMLRKYLVDKVKVSSIVEIIMHMKLELYSLKRQEQNFMTVLQLIKEAFFKHGEANTLKSCVKAITFCASESQADLQDSAQNKLKELEDELVLKLRSAIKQAGVSEDEYSLTEEKEGSKSGEEQRMDSGLVDLDHDELGNSSTSDCPEANDAHVIQRLLKINPTRKDRVKALNQCGITIYTDLVLEVLARHKNDWKIAMFFFVWASQQPGYSNGTETYNALLNILGKAQHFKTMWQLMKQMHNQGDSPSLVTDETFTILIRRYAAAHMVESTIETFDKRE
jgi:pentatricopeptide repeat protein